MTVWVLMGNDSPEAVYSDKAKADAEVERLKGEEAKKGRNQAKIYWRLYEFDLIKT